ncbi:MAG TPA: ATP-binding cassette domain-containing protein [Candidatus Binataceae bacterium]|nr:ATP-binding cassette domain-containing protein [Candidatus Binataceae bacterium]
MLQATAITKRFGRTVALAGVDFDARPGEIHALLGENGAGKTTLMSILAGRLRPDGGEVRLDDTPLRAGSAHAALAAGIAAVNQSPMLFERMTWEENLALGGFNSAARFDLEVAAARGHELAGKLGFALPPAGAVVEEISMAERVRLEVIRALSFNPRVLILDEPTSVLAPSELAPFLDLLRRLRAEGRIVVMITHKLAEAIAVADRITILRQGGVVARTTPKETTETELARWMIGEIVAMPETVKKKIAIGSLALEANALSLDVGGRRILDGMSFRLSAGEIVGVAGVDGNGQTELVELLAGIRSPTGGSLTVSGGADAMAVIPQNRDLDGLILDLSLWENLILARPLRERMSANGWLDRLAAKSLCMELLQRFRIRAAGPDAQAAALSGGNRQRLEVARAIAQKPRLIVAHNVCRGLDFVATAEVHRILLDFAAAGGAVLLVSSDLDEVLAICTRLMVINRGRIRETQESDRDPTRIGLLMAGTVE